MRTGALTVSGITLGLSGLGSETGDARQDDAASSARMYASDFYPEARFRVVSDPLRYEPETPVQEGEAFIGTLYWSDHETRIVRYANTDERVLFFPPLDAEVGTGERYRTGRIRSTEELARGIVTVGFDRVGADGASG